MRLRIAAAAALMTWTLAGSVHAASDHPDIVYLNRCSSGCTVMAGADDAAAGTSALVSGTSSLAAFPDDDAVFDSVAACVRHTLLPFNVHVVANSPGSLPRREVVLTTVSSQLAGQSGGLHDLAPYDGMPHDNRIAFVFANEFGATAVDALCQSAAQQIGFLYGIEYVTGNCPDIEDNSTGCGEKFFTDQDSNCLGGIFNSAGHCILNNTTQNSYASILAVAQASDFILANSFEAFEAPHAGPSP